MWTIELKYMYIFSKWIIYSYIVIAEFTPIVKAPTRVSIANIICMKI